MPNIELLCVETADTLRLTLGSLDKKHFVVILLVSVLLVRLLETLVNSYLRPPNMADGS